MFSKQEIERYNRHIILPEIGLAGQEKLKQAKVLVIGAGGLGCPILQYLTAAGVGKIGICDFDFVDTSNLQRQILYSISDIGKPKAELAAKRLSAINPFVEFKVFTQMLKKENVLEIFTGYDVIVDGSDNFPTRFLINDACVILKKPLVFGAIYKFEGQVTVFNYNGGPTYRCMVPEEPSQSEAPSCSQVGVIGAIPGLIGCYQALEAIKIITGIGTVMSGKLMLIDSLSLMHNFIQISRNAKTAKIKKLGNYGDLCKEQYPDIKQIEPEDLQKLLIEKKARVIDIRESTVFDQYHIESENIPIAELLKNTNRIPKMEKTVILCEIGNNSQAIIETLKKDAEFENLFNLNGGIQAWISKKLPVISKGNI